MSLSFPRTDIFPDRFVITSKFDLMPRSQISRSAGGSVYSKDLGEPIWVGAFNIGQSTLDDCVTFEAMLQSLDGSIQRFEAFDTRRPYPLLHQNGSFSDVGQVKAVAASKRAMSLKNLAAGLTLSVGDRIAMQYGAGSIWSLHVVLETVVVDVLGETAEFDVRPKIPSSVAADDAVRLKRPPAHFILDPSSPVSFSDGGGGLGSVSFSAVQWR